MKDVRLDELRSKYYRATRNLSSEERVRIESGEDLGDSGVLNHARECFDAVMQYCKEKREQQDGAQE